jgi:hypothetical protein
MFRNNLRTRRHAVRWMVMQQNWIVLLGWPTVCAILCLGLWGLTTVKLQRDLNAVESQAMRQATGLARAYADQMASTIAQLDQITRRVQYDWNRGNGKVNLEDQLEKGLYPLSTLLYVTVIGKDGVIITSTRWRTPGRGYTDEAFFPEHRDSRAMGLMISPLSLGKRSGRPLVRFTRRLENSGHHQRRGRTGIPGIVLRRFQHRAKRFPGGQPC